MSDRGARGARRWSPVLAVALGLGLGAPVAHGQSPEESCLRAELPPVTAPAQPLRFGITPQLAGTVGESQGEVLPDDRRPRLEALDRLRPPRRELVIRLNRLFMSDGRAAIRRFARRARLYARRGFAVESQVRYHPAPDQEGDLVAWTRFARRAARVLARNRAVVALSITNEVNLPLSENTSDGAYERSVEAIIRGGRGPRRTAVSRRPRLRRRAALPGPLLAAGAGHADRRRGDAGGAHSGP